LARGAFAAALSLAPGLFAGAAPVPQGHKALQIYFVDVEGGQATLFVTPERKSLLIDTGWPGNNGRDAGRIAAAAKDAGIKKIDFVLITHYHDDHVGGAPQLAAKIPVGRFVDHGENRETSDATTSRMFASYQQLLSSGKYKHIVAKPGEVLPITGMQVRVVTADGQLIERPLPGGGKENTNCENAAKPPVDTTENPRSLGTLITFGKLRILDLGDLTADKEMELMCPMNKIGPVDIYIVSHHGYFQSGSAALVHGIAPRVAIMDNGATKGGSPVAWDVIEKSPGLEDLWQLHFSEEGGSEHNVAAPFLANLQGPDTGNYLKVTALPDGSFGVFNSRTRETKKYAAKN
jgi:beta-lactamase superfamily II metal-dependent hydrolase